MIIEQDGLVFRVGKRLAIGTRPVRMVVAHSLFHRVVWPAFALLWIMLAFALALDMLRAGEIWGLLMPAAFVAAGAALLLFGLRAMLWSRTITVGEDRVTVNERGTTTRRNGDMPLDSFRGVAPLDVAVERDRGAFSLPVIVLDHDDPTRRIVVWSSLSSRRRDEACRDYADWLGLPVVEALRHDGPDRSDGKSAVRRS
jgi:hypothetical protein